MGPGGRLRAGLRFSRSIVARSRAALQARNRFRRTRGPAPLDRAELQRRARAKGAASPGSGGMDEHADLVVALTPLIDVLDRLGVAWYVGGSVASTVHGHFRATKRCRCHCEPARGAREPAPSGTGGGLLRRRGVDPRRRAAPIELQPGSLRYGVEGGCVRCRTRQSRNQHPVSRKLFVTLSKIAWIKGKWQCISLTFYSIKNNELWSKLIHCRANRQDHFFVVIERQRPVRSGRPRDRRCLHEARIDTRTTKGSPGWAAEHVHAPHTGQ